MPLPLRVWYFFIVNYDFITDSLCLGIIASTIGFVLRFDKISVISEMPQDVAFLEKVPLSQRMFGHLLKEVKNLYPFDLKVAFWLTQHQK